MIYMKSCLAEFTWHNSLYSSPSVSVASSFVSKTLETCNIIWETRKDYCVCNLSPIFSFLILQY